MIHILYKEIGETPLECLERYSAPLGSAFGKRSTYAGRLDPIAEGLLPILTDSDIERKPEFLVFDKTYECTAIFGFSSDTLDILGIVSNRKAAAKPKAVREGISNLVGTYDLPYPHYSSKTVGGKPIFKHAREGTQNLDIPLRKMSVKEVEVKYIYEMNAKVALGEIELVVGRVRGDFRQEEIIKSWREKLESQSSVLVAEFSLRVTSGTYIRSLVDKIGEDLRTGALVFRLKRTQVGAYGRETLPRTGIQYGVYGM